ncbi:uncharacterized protein [Palaemon carinicauda]|uniref:uncharacterized protein n=1 Tax=Palaemon carinicauda TaxID=392227 RepID=UPI0035B5B991
MELQLNAKEALTDVHLKAALQKDKGPAAQLLSWTLKEVQEKSDDIIGVVSKVRVSYRMGVKELTVNYITKMIPLQPMKALKDMLTQGCRKELLFYQELLPALNAQLRAVGLEPLRTPKHLYLNHNPDEMLLIMKDLRSQGFQKFRDKNCFDVPHTNLILQELARLHASSLLLEANIGRRNFDIKYGFLEKEWYNVTDDATAFFKTLFEGNIENTVAILKPLEPDESVVRWLRNIKPDVYSILNEQKQRNHAFTTVCHADCITTNMMFRYDDEGYPYEVALLDFQQVRKSSLATDISLLLYICVSGTDRKKNLRGFLQSYFTSFRNVMDAGGVRVPFTFEDLLREYEDKILFGVLWSLSVIPMLAGREEEEEEEEEEEGDDGDDLEKGEQQVGAVVQAEVAKCKLRKDDAKMAAIDSEIHKRFIPIFEELVERRIIR